jgi:hypothetical protein
MDVSGLWIERQTAQHQGFVASVVIFLFKLTRDAQIVAVETGIYPISRITSKQNLQLLRDKLFV